MIAGHWTYRSYRNDPTLVSGNAQTALSLIFGEGVFTLATPTHQSLTGALDMGGGYVLDLKGTVTDVGGLVTLKIAGLGRDGTPTDGWEYDYHAVSGYSWPNGVGQIPSLVGTVLRAKPHDGQPAGLVASFIAIRQP